MKTISHFYHDKPLFGLDIGFSSLKVMQISQADASRELQIIGYGIADFDPALLNEGVIINPEILAKAANNLFKNQIKGEITTNRVVMGVPASRTYSRIIKLPKLEDKELAAAVQLEAEQYIPIPLDQLYLDYQVIRRTKEEIELFAVAAPKKIVDSYFILAEMLGLEAVAMETTVNATSRLFTYTDFSHEPSILIDFGSIAADITIYDKAMVVTGTVSSGSDSFTASIAKKLGVTLQEAAIIKSKYGVDPSKKQKEIVEAVKPQLEQLLREIRRMIRYYEERSGSDNKVSQVVTVGGGASMPGLNAHLTELLRLPTRMIDPWQHINFDKLPLPGPSDRSVHSTVCGLALLKPEEIFS
jgi:type IV pilus assembly protein PilM